MDVRDLQQFLHSVRNFVGAHSGQAADIDLLVAALEPMGSMTLAEFVEALHKVTTRAANGKKAGNDKRENVQGAVAVLNDLYQRCTQPTLSYREIAQTVRALHDSFDVSGFKEVAKGFGILTGLTSKKSCEEKILAKINDRKGSFERGQAIARAAQVSQDTLPSKTQ